jgi:hypothetical protein
MILSELERDYNMTDADLCMFVSNLVGFMNRDILQFENWGADAAAISALEARGDAFETFPTDLEFKADVGIATEDKDATAENLRSGIRQVAARAENKWGASAARYKKFGVAGLSKMNDRDLLVCGRRVVHVGTGFLALLADLGLTQAMLDDLEALAQTFENNMNALKDAIAERDIKTEERRSNGNELYAFVVKYCNAGKQIWEGASEAKYNDYIIYKSTDAPPGQVTGLSYDRATGQMSWDAPESATEIDKYRLMLSADGEKWARAYLGPETHAGVPLATGTNYFRCRAHNKNGWGKRSDILEVHEGGELAPPAWVNANYSETPDAADSANGEDAPKFEDRQVEVSWADVELADMYEVWRAVSESGAVPPPEDFSRLAELSELLFKDSEIGHKVTNFYYVVSKNADEVSNPSVMASVYIFD